MYSPAMPLPHRSHSLAYVLTPLNSSPLMIMGCALVTTPLPVLRSPHPFLSYGHHTPSCPMVTTPLPVLWSPSPHPFLSFSHHTPSPSSAMIIGCHTPLCPTPPVCHHTQIGCLWASHHTLSCPMGCALVTTPLPVLGAWCASFRSIGGL
jgi:hypothetical protein